MERKELQKIILFGMTSILTKEQHDEFKKLLTQMSDEENITLKDALNANKNFIATKPRNFIDKSGCKNLKIEFLPEDENKKVWEKLRTSKPTDLNNDSIESLFELISFDKNKLQGIPSDILFADNIPLPNAVIKCNYPNEIESFEVIIYPDYKQIINNSDENNPVKVGAMILYIDNSKIFMEIEILKGFDYIITSGIIGCHKVPTNTKEFMIDKLSAADIVKIFSSNLAIWYGVQIALLNPIIKETFAKNTETTVLKEEHNPKKRESKKKVKVRYIKRHVISADDINRRHNSKYERKTYSWYVIGHWRTYKNGHKIFIKPYWKGILSDSKKYNDSNDIRERDIVVPDKIE